MKRVRLTAYQKRALNAYRYAERQEDRYLGSVFVTPSGQREHAAKVTAAYEECKKLAMSVEHGL